MADQNLFQKLENTSFYRNLKYGLNRRLLRFFQENVFMGNQSLQIAEVACGSGFGAHLVAAQKEIKLSVAADIDLMLFNQSDISEFKAQFVVADIFYPPFQAGSFDLVWNSSSIEELENPQDALLKMAQMVKPGGYVFVGVPYLVGPLALYYLTPIKSWRTWLGRPHSFSELETMLKSCGLEPRKRLVYFARFFGGVLAAKTS